MARRGMEHSKPQAVSRKLDPAKQAAFIKSYENLLNQIGDDEAVLFADPRLHRDKRGASDACGLAFRSAGLTPTKR